MKKLLSLIGATIIGAVIITGCSTSQQRTTYNTLSSVEATAQATVTGYYTAAAKGLADTNGIPNVTKAFNDFQVTMQVAELVAQNNSNALAPSSLVQELSAVVSAVAQFTSPTSVTITP